MDKGADNYRRYLDGDDACLVEIIKLYRDGLVLYLNSYVSDILIAEELMEDTFFKLAAKRPKFSEKSQFKTWLYAIARNTAKDYLRHKSRHVVVSAEHYQQSLAEEESIERDYIIKEQKIMVHKALSKLKPEYNQVLYLIHFEGFSNNEVALAMKKTNRQIENLVYRAKQALKEQLEEEGFVYEEL